MNGSVRKRTTTVNAAAWSKRILLSRRGSRSGPLSPELQKGCRDIQVSKHPSTEGKEAAFAKQVHLTPPKEDARNLLLEARMST